MFFGVKAEVLRIGDSLPAPNFDLIVQPNEWEKEVTSPTPSPKLKAYEGFFTGLLPKVKQRLPGFTSASKGLPQNWFNFPAGRTGFVYSAAFAKQRQMRVELYIDVGDADRNKAVFDRFFSEKNAIEAESGQFSRSMATLQNGGWWLDMPPGGHYPRWLLPYCFCPEAEPFSVTHNLLKHQTVVVLHLTR